MKVFRITSAMSTQQRRSICGAHPSCHAIKVATRRMTPELVKFLNEQHGRGMSVSAENSRIADALRNAGVTVASNRSLTV